jgi:alkylation response protein AidB-like acyl-CoA dehydrogenase
MEFKLSRSQKEIQKAAKDFAKGEFDKDLAMQIDKKSVFPKDLHEKASELGFIGIHFDEKYMGGGLGMVEYTLMAEELCRKDPTMGSALMLAGYGAECLQRSGSVEMKNKYLVAVAEGKMRAGAAVPHVKPGNGVSSVDISAEQKDDFWMLNGTIHNVINAGAAGFYCVLCRTAKDLSIILVEGDREGIVVSDAVESLGMRMTVTADLHFKNVRVPLSNLIGKEGEGVKLWLSFSNETHVFFAALALGIGQGALDRTISYVKQREQFGKKIAQFQVTGHKLAEMALKMELARSLTYQAAWQMDQKKPDTRQAAMSKLAAIQAAVEVSHEAIQLHGGYGYTTEYEVERFCRDAKMLGLLSGGTNKIKDEIAAGVIGKIR